MHYSLVMFTYGHTHTRSAAELAALPAFNVDMAFLACFHADIPVRTMTTNVYGKQEDQAKAGCFNRTLSDALRCTAMHRRVVRPNHSHIYDYTPNELNAENVDQFAPVSSMWMNGMATQQQRVRSGANGCEPVIEQYGSSTILLSDMFAVVFSSHNANDDK